MNINSLTNKGFVPNWMKAGMNHSDAIQSLFKILRPKSTVSLISAHYCEKSKELDVEFSVNYATGEPIEDNRILTHSDIREIIQEHSISLEYAYPIHGGWDEGHYSINDYMMGHNSEKLIAGLWLSNYQKKINA